MNTIGTMILYSTQCDKFIREIIKQCKKFSTKICIITTDKSFDGNDTQDEQKLKKLYDDYINDPIISCIELEWSKDQIFPGRESYELSMKNKNGWAPGGWIKGWYGICRYTGFLNLKDETDYVLFLDSDEIVDGERFNLWKSEELNKYPNIEAFKFLNYWYLNDPTKQATSLEDSIVMIKSVNYPENLFFTDAERHGMCNAKLNRLENITYQGIPIIHHYSYVRDKTALIGKMKNTHGQDICNESEVLQSVEKILSGIDIIHQYKYKSVNNCFNIQ